AHVQGANPDTVLLVDAGTDRPEGVGGIGRAQAAEAAGLGGLVAPGLQGFTICGELLDAARDTFRREDIPLAVAGQEVRSAEARASCLRSTKLTCHVAVTAPREEKLAFCVELLHAVITLVGHIYRTLRSEDHSRRLFEFAVSLAAFTPLAKYLTF